jgi:hypothetical protein
VRRARIAAIGLVLMIGLTTTPAGASELNYPTTVHLTRGASSTADADAPPLVSSSNAQYYVVTATKRDGILAAAFSLTFTGLVAAESFTLQWDGVVSAPCALTIAMFDRRDRRWRSTTTRVDGPVPPYPQFTTNRPQRYVKEGAALARMRCVAKHAFTLSTDRVRLIAPPPL